MKAGQYEGYCTWVTGSECFNGLFGVTAIRGHPNSPNHVTNIILLGWAGILSKVHRYQLKNHNFLAQLEMGWISDW